LHKVNSSQFALPFYAVFFFFTSALRKNDNRKYLFTIPTRPQMQFHFNSKTGDNGRGLFASNHLQAKLNESLQRSTSK
jgi:hypothetical protein